MRLLLIWFITKFSYTIGSEISYRIYNIYIHQPYFVHISNNSNEVISTVIAKVNNIIQGTIIPLITIFSSMITLIFILSFLIYINIHITVISFLIFSVIYLVILYFSSKILKINSRILSKEQNNVLKILNEGLGNIREILINRYQVEYSKVFYKSNFKLKKAQGVTSFIAMSPRYAIEALAISFLALMSYYLISKDNSFIDLIPIMGLFAISAQRILPLLQQIFSSLSSIQANYDTMNDITFYLNKKIKKISSKENIIFSKKLRLENISFRYNINTPFIFKNSNVVINKGDLVGVVGESGSGKSTLIDIIMGLLSPSSGSIFIDETKISENNNYSWQQNISHVPQSIYLTDDSILNNIILGGSKKEVESQRLNECIEQSSLSEVIESLDEKLLTRIGERGVKLSGGQRQRIGIARALYKKSQILILDEATNALDQTTETKIINAITQSYRDMTIIIIAHRLSTLKDCNKFLKIKDNKIETLSRFEEILS